MIYDFILPVNRWHPCRQARQVWARVWAPAPARVWVRARVRVPVWVRVPARVWAPARVPVEIEAPGSRAGLLPFPFHLKE